MSCFRCGFRFSTFPMTNMQPTGLPSRPSTESSVAMSITRSMTSGLTPSGSMSRCIKSSENSFAISNTTIVSIWLLSRTPPMQHILSLGLNMPRVNPIIIALLSCEKRILEKLRTFITSQRGSFIDGFFSVTMTTLKSPKYCDSSGRL